MTCRVLITAPDGMSVEARALLASASFVSERLVQSPSLPCASQQIRISDCPTKLRSSPLQLSDISSQTWWQTHRGHSCCSSKGDIRLASFSSPLRFAVETHLGSTDPGFGQPGCIDMLFGADIFVEVLRHGRRTGPTGSPTAFETEYGWVLCGKARSTPSSAQANLHVTTFHTSVASGDDIHRKFWEVKETHACHSSLSMEEHTVVRHFEKNHSCTKEGRFVVPLLKDPSMKPIGESRSQAVQRFYSLECSLKARSYFQQFDKVMQEYLDLGHAELIPATDLERPLDRVFYLLMHAVWCTRL